jgi:hypothetical protein
VRLEANNVGHPEKIDNNGDSSSSLMFLALATYLDLGLENCYCRWRSHISGMVDGIDMLQMAAKGDGGHRCIRRLEVTQESLGMCQLHRCICILFFAWWLVDRGACIGVVSRITLWERGDIINTPSWLQSCI